MLDRRVFVEPQPDKSAEMFARPLKHFLSWNKCGDNLIFRVIYMIHVKCGSIQMIYCK